MRRIPTKLREEMHLDHFYHRCCYHKPTAHGRGEKVEWHHNLIFAGRQVNEKFCIIPLCPEIHSKANDRGVREILDWIMLNRASDEELRRYSKAVDLIRKKEELNKKLGVWHGQKK